MNRKQSNNDDKIGISIVDITGDFAFESEVEVKFRIFKLIANERCMYDEFLGLKSKLFKNKKKTIEQLKVLITLLLEGSTLPPKKIKALGQGEYELRIGRTRLYFFTDEQKKIIVLGEINKDNKTQKKSIEAFKSYKELYESQKNEL